MSTQFKGRNRKKSQVIMLQHEKCVGEEHKKAISNLGMVSNPAWDDLGIYSNFFLEEVMSV